MLVSGMTQSKLYSSDLNVEMLNNTLTLSANDCVYAHSYIRKLVQVYLQVKTDFINGP